MSEDIKSDLKAYYDLEAGSRNERPVREWKYRIRDGFLGMAAAEGKSTLLEIGAGTGKDSAYFIEKGFRVTAVDLSAAMVGCCREKGVEAYELDYAEVARLGRKFECIWSMNSLLHLEKSELPHVLGELDDVLNENGLFHFGVYGGEDRAGVVKTDEYPVPRYFSFFSDENLKAAVSPYFNIERFEIIMLDEDLHFQSLILRKKRD